MYEFTYWFVGACILGLPLLAILTGMWLLFRRIARVKGPR
jgi:hypothetical protein